MKKCSKCKKKKPKSNFWIDRSRPDGLCARCNDCQAVFNREKRKRNPETYRAKSKRYYYTHKEEIAKKRKEFNKLNQDKMQAHGKARTALYNGSLLRQPCEVCGETKSHAHHDDYSQALKVRWLCSPCHQLWHSRNGEGKRAS